MPQRMRLGPTSGGSIDTVRALVQLDQTDFQDLELSAETRKAILRATNDGVLVDAQGGDVTLESATGDVLPGSSNPALGTSATPWPSVSTEKIGNERHYAGAYAGADADARLDNAISAASISDTIYLENHTYTSDRTISKQLTVVGMATGEAGSGSAIEAEWTFSDRVTLKGVNGVTGTGHGIVANAALCRVYDGVFGSGFDITANADAFLFEGNFGSAGVTFASGTSGGLVDSSMSVTVTDNGTNTVGDTT